MNAFQKTEKQSFTRLAVVLCIGILCCVATTAVDGKKKLPIHEPFPPIVQNAIQCDVCAFSIVNTLQTVEAKRDEALAQRLHFGEDAVLDVLEHLCIPFKENGEWMRRVAIGIRDAPVNDPADTAVKQPETVYPYSLRVDVLENHTACQRTCSTVVDLCERIMDDNGMDDFSGAVLAMTKEDVIADQAHASLLIRQFCGPMQVCKKHYQYVKDLERELSINTELLDAIRRDEPKQIEQEELEMERMLHDLEREQRRKADVYSRQEIGELQRAIIEGRFEDAVALDPQVKDLSEDEFWQLQQLMARDGYFANRDDKAQFEDQDDEDDL